MTADDIVERIRKLMRLAENAAATEAEAASALERANALLARHNLVVVARIKSLSVLERGTEVGANVAPPALQADLVCLMCNRTGRQDSDGARSAVRSAAARSCSTTPWESL